MRIAINIGCLLLLLATAHPSLAQVSAFTVQPQANFELPASPTFPRDATSVGHFSFADTLDTFTPSLDSLLVAMRRDAFRAAEVDPGILIFPDLSVDAKLQLLAPEAQIFMPNAATAPKSIRQKMLALSDSLMQK